MLYVKVTSVLILLFQLKEENVIRNEMDLKGLFGDFFFVRDGEELLPCNRIDTSVCTSSGMTALHLAAQGGYVKVVEQLLNCQHKW